MATLLAGTCFLLYYFHVFLRIGTIITHIFYVPIILASIWWKRKGLVVALFSSGLLIFSHVFLRPDVATHNDYFRAFMFIVIAFVVAELSRRIVKVEETLRDSEALYVSLVENLVQHVYRKDLEGKFAFGNKRFCETLGKGLDEIIGKTDFDFYPAALAKKYRRDDQRVIKTGEIFDAVEEHQLPDVKKICVQVVKTPLRDSGGKTIGTQGIFWDITERKQLEEQLKAANQQLVASEQQLKAANQQLKADEQQLKAANQQLKADEQQLRAANQQLEANAQQLKVSNQQLKSLASQLTLSEERERQRIAAELHDQISQSLVISRLELETLRESAPSEKLTKALGKVCDSLDQTIQNTRSLTFDLGSPILYELGFEAAVAEWLAEQIQERHGIKARFQDDGRPKLLGDDIRVPLFRSVRELLVNVVKHAHAHEVKVSVRRVGREICLNVEDDGVGFDLTEVASIAAKMGGFGLFSIRERLEQLGGHLEIESKPGHGTRVTMTAPLKGKKAIKGARK